MSKLGVCSECQQQRIALRVHPGFQDEEGRDLEPLDEASEYLLCDHDFKGQRCAGSGRVPETVYFKADYPLLQLAGNGDEIGNLVIHPCW